MSTNAPALSENFQRLYCDPAVYENFSAWLPIRFNRVLPFQADEPVIDDDGLLAAEMAYLGNPNPTNRIAVVDAFAICGLLPAEEASNVKSELEFFDADFFQFMGETYANASMFTCALRWYREYIGILERQSRASSDSEDVYADVGYCLYALGLSAEAVAWTKSCLGPELMQLIAGAALVDYQAHLLGGRLFATERATGRTRFTASTTQDPQLARQTAEGLKLALKTPMPFQETYIDWVRADSLVPPKLSEDYPFKNERDQGCLPRHKMNLLFAAVAQADTLAANGNNGEARRLLQEAALLAPQADFVQTRLKTIS